MKDWEPNYQARIKQFNRQMKKKRDKILAEAREKDNSQRSGVMRKCPVCSFQAKLLKRKSKKRWGSLKLLAHFEENHAPSIDRLKGHTVFQCDVDKCKQNFCTYDFEIMNYHLVSQRLEEFLDMYLLNFSLISILTFS